MTRRIGLFGGSFDPVHQGHLALARSALAALQLDELLWVPAGHAWQKARPLTDAHHRAAMLALAIADEPRFVLSRCELDRSGPSFTIDTLRALQAQQAPADWWLILGQDQYANLHTWHEWQSLLGMVTLAVAARDGQPPQAPALQAVPHRLQVLAMPTMPVSATQIRTRLQAGDNPALLAPAMLLPSVASYIAQNALYRHSSHNDQGDADHHPS